LRICFKSYLDQLNAVETFSKYDKNNLKDMLNLIVIWLRDALLLFNPLDEKELDHKLVNIDKIDILEKFVKAFDSIDFEKAFENLENAIEMIDRNVNPQLVFTVLLSEFNNIFVLKGKTL
jgi:DNA polymerase-3 subunit delta'